MAINLSPQAVLCHHIQQCILLLCTYSNLYTQEVDMVDIVLMFIQTQERDMLIDNY